MEDINFQLITNFGPTIFKVKIPKSILDKLNNHIDNAILDKEKINKLNYGEKLVGDVTQEFKLEKNFCKESGWLNFLAQSAAKWIYLSASKKITKFELIESWVVRQFKNEYNPVHWHSGHISGAGFLKVPSTFGDFTQHKKEKDYVGGNLELIHGSRMFLSNSKYSIKPEVGDFYFFPNYLMHVVYPFKNSDAERRSISFNAFIDDKIYNAYG